MTIEAERIAWLRTAGPLTTDNMRWSSFIQIKTDIAGNYWQPFSVPFDTETLAVDVTIDFSGGARPWIYGIRDVNTGGFGITIWNSQTNTGIGQTTVGIYWVAFGR